ncbi:dual specificity mitogen-activated protein kinase kinase hemipterous-like isoform X1 [Bradysia coprophila]|uniref:dual specificity mitogen-activated protein kinase kinase hemipterous-like isoform X1 n=1 Tax=Bradysia coprophila TaxID=38358 RepID=UPI00187DD607|nr:dual specificity mitogen-activated protein kinase kinase hemipterous-like isoform X1 [Bradysia coprophila]
MAKTEDLSSRLQLLQEKLTKEIETRDNMIPQSFGHSKRPSDLGQGTPTAGRKMLLKLPFSQQPPANVIEPETENKLQNIKERNGILNIDDVPHKTDIKDLEHLGELGNGTSGHVVQMRHKQTGRVIAVKQMRRTGNHEETKRIIMDIDVVLKSHDCPYIVECLGCFITEMDVWICMELMATCFDKLLKKSNRPVPEHILGKVTVATVKALSYLKDVHGVIHRDIKPSNLLIDERGNIKLCDFGISGRLVDSKAKTRSAGCAAYMAPERIDPKKPEYDIRADVWSLGITLVELATGSFPYKGCKTDFEVLTRVLEADPPCLPTDKDFSIEFQTFVRRCLTKNYKERPKYPELQEQPFLKIYEQKPVDVAGWFAHVMETSGIKSNCRNSPLPDTTARLKTSTQIPNYQYNNINNSSSNSLLNKQHSHSILSSSPSTPPPNQKPQLYQNAAVKHQYPNHDSSHQQPNHLNQLKQMEMNGVTPSPPPPLLPKKQFYVQRNGGYMKDETDIINEMNQLYMKSPFAQRRCQPSDGDYGSSPSPKMDAIYNNIAHNRTQKYFPGSPYLQRKYSQPQDSFWNLQHPPDGVGGSKSATTSPYARKRFQTTIPVSDQTQCTRPLGNTSPIVLQRFYHQQSQHRDKSERNRPVDSTNPFLSHIPKYQFDKSFDPTHEYLQPPNTPPSCNSYIPTYQPQSNQNGQKNPFTYTNSNNRKISSKPQNVYNEHGGSNSGYGNQDVYSNNLYGRTMSKMDGKPNAEKNVVNGKSESSKEDQGWFNSFAGVVKRRFASYVKLNLTSGDKQQQQQQQQQEKEANSSADKRSSPNPNTYGTSGSQLPVSSMIYPPSPHILSIDRRHHRSPDPPPRYNRGQSPLVLRRNLLEYGQTSSGSPIPARRLTSPSPPLPPRRGSESVPGSPQHFRTKIHYTPEPQRRIYRTVDQ